MKTIGLLGGMSWESSAEYYRLINQDVHRRLGGHHSAECLMYSVDFAPIEAVTRRTDWSEAGALLADAARSLERGGAEFLVMTTNTLHRVASTIEAAIEIPFLHIGDTTAEAIRAYDVNRVGLLATAFTMEQDFYRDRLASHGIEVVTPSAEDRAEVHRIIYEELVHGVVRPEARDAYRAIMERLVAKTGVEGIVYGCTEITLLVDESDTTVPVFDTTRLHATAAVDYALA